MQPKLELSDFNQVYLPKGQFVDRSNSTAWYKEFSSPFIIVLNINFWPFPISEVGYICTPTLAI